MSAMTSEERYEFVVSAKKRRKMTKAERKKAVRRGKKLRRIRKYRSKIKKASGAGQKGTVTLPGGERRIVRKKFYIMTWDAKGNPTGMLWYVSPKPDKDKLLEYKQKHGVKHPLQLPVRNKK